MALKSTQTNPYETRCFVQETPTSSELTPNGYKVKKSIKGDPFCIFESTLMTFNCYNRMKRRYDGNNISTVIATDERIQTLKRQNKWRGELNHPNPEIKGQVFSDIRMTIPEQTRTSHIITKDSLIGDRYRATIITDPGSPCGVQTAVEIIDLGKVPSYSVRLLGNAIPNAPMGQPNMRVSKVITFDEVDYPSHPNADGDISLKNVLESYSEVFFLKELAKYCVNQDETMRVVCESFEISPEEILGISNGNIVVEQFDHSQMHFPLCGDIRKEALSAIFERGIK